jgi:hypothetical protein
MDGDGGGETIQGELPAEDPWHQRYAASSPGDTDGGARPQNLFRLIRRQSVHSPQQQVQFNIQRANASGSPNRNASNGVLLLSRYLGGDDLYYAGVRVDGQAVVKKKSRGRYFTLGSTPVFAGRYDRQTAPNLIPEDRWITLASDVRTNPDGAVQIGLSVDGSAVLTVVDGGRTGGPPIRSAGMVGIRSDFLDVQFRGYAVGEAAR